jgi:uncharacterized protein YdeI (YjbR/CyaY-like superfamily)
MTPRYFDSASAFRRWLEQHHASASELVVGFYNKASGQGGLTYAEALDEALCFGWIDGVRRRLDAARYTIRFTPRRPRSIWSRVNLRHVARLRQLGKMHAAGLAALAARTEAKTGVYSFENRPQKFPERYARVFRAKKAAWAFWQQQPPGYRRTAIWWVASAKQETTRQRRLDQLIADSTAGHRLQVIAGRATPRPAGHRSKK